MSDHYYHPSDGKYLRQIRQAVPDGLTKWLEFDDAALHADTKAIPPKYTELMSLAVALTTQCAYCIEIHTIAAKAAGATKEEIGETILITAALRSGAAIGHGLMAMKLYETAEEGEHITQ